MTPKEKADELIEKYRPLTWGNTMYTRKSRLRKCCLICVDEIIASDSLDQFMGVPTSLGYWLEVREEIEKTIKTN